MRTLVFWSAVSKTVRTADPTIVDLTGIFDLASNRRHLPRLAIRPAEHCRGFIVADDRFGSGVPFEARAIQPHCDVAEVADRDRTVGHLDRRGGGLAGDHAVDEVSEVVVALVEVDLVGANHRVDQRLRVGLVLATVRVHFAFGPFPCHSRPFLVGDDHRDPVFINRLEAERGRRVPERVGREFPLGVADLDRTGVVGSQPPLRAVGVVSAPVGQLATGVVEDPAVVDVAARGRMGHPGRDRASGRIRAHREPARRP